MLLVGLPFVNLSSSLDVPLIITPGADGIASIDGYSISITPWVIPEANTTFSDLINLFCPSGYLDEIGIHNVTLNPSQISEFAIFVNYSGQKILLYYYKEGSTLVNQTFTLNPGTSAIMGMSITTTVTEAGPIDNIIYNIVVSATPYEAHDVAITNLTHMMYHYPKSAENVTIGQRVNLTATAANLGVTAENFTVSFYYGTEILGNITVTNLQPGTETNVTYTWDTVDLGVRVPGENKTVTAKASTVPGETNIDNNAFTDGWIMLWLPGDGNHDGRVNYKDLNALAVAYGSKLGDPYYNPDFDFNSDGRINYRDLNALAIRYGMKI